MPARNSNVLSRAARVRRALSCAAFAAAMLAQGASPATAQRGGIVGRIEQAATGQPVGDVFVGVAGTSLHAFTAADGTFRIDSVAVGRHTLRLMHIGFGEHTVAIEVLAGTPVPVRITLSDAAVELESIEVVGLSTSERVARGAGHRRSIVTRDQLAQLETTSVTLADALRQFVPSVRTRQVNLVGSPVCIELRTIRATFRNECLSPAVYLDGVPVTNPTLLYGALDIAVVETVEVVPAAEAGARFGTGALYGALLIETRRPGAVGDDPTRLIRSRAPGFDWSQEPTSHPSTRSFLYGLLGNAVGLAIGLSAANECIGTRAPSNDRIIAKCDGGPTFASATAALVLPAFGGAMGSRIGGATETSRGRLLPGLVGGAMALIPAYGLLFSAERLDSDVMRGVGLGIIVIGVPAATTFADHQFRKRR